MPRFDRYMLSQLMVIFGLSSLVLVMVYWINRAVRLFDQIIASGESATVFVELSLLTLPNVIRLVLPISAFVSAVYVTNRMTTESELVIVQSTGYSPWRLARPVLIFGILVALFVSVLAHLLVPASLTRLADRQAEIAENVTSRLLVEGRFIHPSDGVTFYIGSISQNGELEDVFLFDARSEARRITYTAARALLVRGESGPTLLMFDGMAQALLPETRAVSVTRFDNFAFDIAALFNTGSSDRRRLYERFTPELLFPTEEVLRESRATLAKAYREAHLRFTHALFCIVTSLLGFAVLQIGSFSRFGVWRQILGAIAIGVILQSLGNAMWDIASDDADLWPLHYLPSVLGFAIIGGILFVASSRQFWRRRSVEVLQ